MMEAGLLYSKEHYDYLASLVDRISAKRREKKGEKKQRSIRQRYFGADDRRKYEPAVAAHSSIPTYSSPASGSKNKARTLLGLEAKTLAPQRPGTPRKALNPFIETSHPLHVARSRVHIPERSAEAMGRTFLDMSDASTELVTNIPATRLRAGPTDPGRSRISSREVRQPSKAQDAKEVARRTKDDRHEEKVSRPFACSSKVGKEAPDPLWDQSVDLDDLLRWYESWGFEDSPRSSKK